MFFNCFVKSKNHLGKAKKQGSPIILISLLCDYLVFCFPFKVYFKDCLELRELGMLSEERSRGWGDLRAEERKNISTLCPFYMELIFINSINFNFKWN